MLSSEPRSHSSASKRIPGTKPSLHNPQLLISSGIPSLDHVLGGGLPIGSVFLIEEDVHGKYANVMFKYFLSEGIVCNQPTFIASLDNDSSRLIYELPSPTNVDIDALKSDKLTKEDDMKIAWRYNNLGIVQSTMDSNLQFGHYFDISTPINKETINSASIKHWKYSQDANENIYQNLLHHIKTIINNGNYRKNESMTNNQILRIAIQSLGSPFWQKNCKISETEFLSDHQDLLQFLYNLRAIVRNTFTSVFLTMPAYLFDNPNIILHIRHIIDACVRLDSFGGTDRENNPALNDYHGLFYIPKLYCINTLASFIPPTLDLAFKLRRKKFLIEKLHLPPELQETSEREQDDGSTVGCSSISKNKNLEF